MVRVSVIQAVSPSPESYSNRSTSVGAISFGGEGVSPTPFGSNNNVNDRPQSALSHRHYQQQSPELTIVYNCSSFEDLQQQDREANEFLASLIMAGGANNNNGSSNGNNSQSQRSTSTNMAMTNQNNGNGNARFTKTKSGSLPGRYTSTNTGMGAGVSATAVLLSPQPYSSSPSSIPPGAYYHNYSARPYLFMPATATTPTNPPLQRPSHSPISPVVAPGRGGSSSSNKEKEGSGSSSKKWNPFGGLFRRKDKPRQKLGAGSTTTTTVAAIPIKIQFEASQRPALAPGRGAISSGGSDYEAESLSESGSSRSSDGGDRKKRSSFLGRRLSGGKKKQAKSKSNPAVVHADLLRFPGGPAPVLRRHPHSNGAQNQARNQNRYSQPILQSWETTKKIAVVPPTSASSLLMLNSPNYAYSDSGSLSLSLEGSSSLTKGSKAAAKEATKARAEARRNSYIQDDSSEEEGHGHGHDASGRGAGGGGSGSYHGSHSSLSLRNSGSGGGKKNGSGYGFRNGNAIGALAPAPARPALLSADNLGLPFPYPYQSSTSSPTLHYQQQQHQHQQQHTPMPMQTPTSPRWEARVVYTKETLEDDGKPVVVKLPKYSARHASLTPTTTAQETLSSDVNEDGQIVVTAGLRVPIAMTADRVHFSEGVREPIYANTKTSTNPASASTSALPLPPKGGFYRPMSCSFLDSYRQQENQPQSLLQYEKEPARLRSPVDSDSRAYAQDFEFDRVPLLSAASVAAKLLPTPSSPVHSRAANFWKQKEQETLQHEHGPANGGTGNGTGTGSSRGVSVSPSPVRDRDRPPIGSGQAGSRIRSADSSPLLQPRHQHQHNATNATTATASAATAAAAPTPAHRSLNSTESISSLSSFTTNETHSPSPSNMYGNSNNANPNMNPRPPSRNTARGKIPAGFQQRSSYRSNRALAGNELRPSAGASVFGAGRLSPTARSTPLSNGTDNGNADYARNNNAMTMGSPSSSSIKSPGRNLEDALNELEDMYKSLQLSDEDLLDRAERRDLPTPHQELRNKDLGYFNFDESPQPQTQNGHAYVNGNEIGNSGSVNALNEGRIQSPIYYYSPSPTAYGHGHGHGVIGSVESLASGTGTSGSGDFTHYGRRPASRVRAPPLRRAGVPDLVNDDMAKRKYDASTKEPKIVDAREQISQTGSYLVLSPAFSPPVSPIPSSIDAGQQYQNYDPSQSNLLLSQPNDPDLTQDDVTVRNYKRANAIRIIPEPQPKFGIPLGPITKAPNSDYLHATPVERHRPLYRHVKNPDLIKDDIAFRALRKDLNQENNNLSSCQWTPKLFSPLKNFENVFNYNENLINGTGTGAGDAGTENEKAKNKRLRAVRSLSANISSLQSNLMGRSPPPTTGTRQSPVNSFYSLAGSGATGKEVGNNSDYKFYKTRAGAGGGTRSYMEPSWVQQIELDQDELRELKRSLSPTRVMPLIRSRDVNPVTVHQKVKQSQLQRPAVTVTRTSSSPADSKPRRPWTDLILEGLEKEKEELERERETKQAELEWERERERQLLQNGASYEHEYEYGCDDEEDVFMDASSQTPRELSPYEHVDVEPTKSHEQLHVWPDQKKGENRRGSWAENTTTSTAGAGTATAAQAYMTHLLTGTGASTDSKRRSWSDFPQSSSSSVSHYPTASASGTHPITTTSSSLDFNPIAPPRRVKQINLEGFHSSSSKHDNDNDEHSHEETMQPTSILKQSAMTKENTMTSPSTTQGERELDNLIHALVKEADTCGPKDEPSASAAEPVLEPRRKRKLEIKARYPIDNDDELFRSKPSTSSTSSIEPQSPQAQAQPPPHRHAYSIGHDNIHDPITRLIKTINENLVPSLETSIRESETRMSQMNLAAAASEGESAESSEPASKSKSSKPKPLPRHKSHDHESSADDSTLNSSTDKQSKETNFSQLQSSRTGVVKTGTASAFTPLTVTQSTLCLGRWPKSTTVTATSADSTNSIPAIQITDPDTAAVATGTGKSFLRPKKKDPTAMTVGDASKRDSLSDAEGMTLLKKLLARENSGTTTGQQFHNQIATRAPVLEESNSFLAHHGGIKKCPSTGTTNTATSFKAGGNWSSANPNLNLATPPFLRKYFKDLHVPAATVSVGAEVPKQEQANLIGTRAPVAHPFHMPAVPSPKEEPKPPPKDVLALNVAQKANLFMKLEHEQRFSKWRKNSEAQESQSKNVAPRQQASTTGSRFSTQPVTTQEISSALSIGHGHVHAQAVKPETQQEQAFVSVNEPTHANVGAAGVGAERKAHTRKLSKSNDDDLNSISKSTAEVEKRKSSIFSLKAGLAPGSNSNSNVSPDKKPAARIEPSCLSIKDRVSLFNRISSVPTATVHPMPVTIAVAVGPAPPTSRFSRSPAITQSASASAPESSPQVVHRRNTTNFNQHQVLLHENLREEERHNRTDEHVFARAREPHSSRHTKGKSLTVAHSWEPDYASEDGEVSSGGQEVSDIISKSYDNSPMFRKKSWKSQIPQPSLSKEIWRKFEARGTHGEQEQVITGEPNSSLSTSTNSYTNGTGALAPGFVAGRVGPTSTSTAVIAAEPMTNTAAAVMHSSSSNLLPILRVLSSSDDALDPDTAEEYAAKLKIDATTSQAKDPSKKSVRKYLKMRTTESFQNQSHKQQQQKPEEPIYDNVSASINLKPTPPPAAPEASTSAEPELQLSAVQREGELLVMKKHMPIVKRKSSHKASKNPLKALAARLDFRTQD